MLFKQTGISQVLSRQVHKLVGVHHLAWREEQVKLQKACFHDKDSRWAANEEIIAHCASCKMSHNSQCTKTVLYEERIQRLCSSIYATIPHFHVITQFSSHNKLYSVSNGLGSNTTGTIISELQHNISHISFLFPPKHSVARTGHIPCILWPRRWRISKTDQWMSRWRCNKCQEGGKICGWNIEHQVQCQ